MRTRLFSRINPHWRIGIVVSEWCLRVSLLEHWRIYKDRLHCPFCTTFQALFAGVFVLSFRVGDLVRIPLLLAVNVLLLLHNMREAPCPVREVNTLRTATLAGAVWAGSASLLFVAQIQSRDQ